MRKISLAFCLTCVIVMLCAQVAFGYPLVDESTGTPAIGAGEAALTLDFQTATPNSAIATHRDANASIMSGISIDPSSLASLTFEYKFSVSKNLLEPVKVKNIGNNIFI